jgi:hypothetical protein
MKYLLMKKCPWNKEQQDVSLIDQRKEERKETKIYWKVIQDVMIKRHEQASTLSSWRELTIILSCFTLEFEKWSDMTFSIFVLQIFYRFNIYQMIFWYYLFILYLY